MMKNFTAKTLVRIALMTVVIIVCSWINVPYVVPFTLQTFAVFFALEILGGFKGTVSIVVYVLLALVGVPVLAGFRGGVGALLGPTGGYVIGFIFSGAVYLAFVRKERSFLYRLVACIVSLLACYVCGTLWFWLGYSGDTGISGLWSALLICVVPYIGFDIAKILLAVFLGGKIKKIIDRDSNR